ncbi:PLxRFG domain-containing protein [Marinobacterium iners]|uniref:Large polyvalent protein-associated domain-containing protein n=1 Tax=Marinobacterium iners DSM 11526 TaxID=1122198 RepID=A0A1H3X3D4_9GAMM|nr:PLxRFG domain-containing protein [Marinobacterium iners]SDZ93897.1 hypothetical protein SAMN02745729_10128 [Marinobacterium iners DSM 11526]
MTVLQWPDLAASERFQGFTDEQKGIVRDTYFKDHVLPGALESGIPEEQVRNRFYQMTQPDIAPSQGLHKHSTRDLLDRSGEDLQRSLGAKDALGSASAAPEYNMARGALERGGQLLGGLFRAADTVANKGDELLPLGGLSLSDDFVLKYDGPEEYRVKMEKAGIRGALDIAADAWEKTDAGYVPNHTWEKVKSEFGNNGPFAGSAWAEVAMYATEQGIKSIPDMAAAVFSLPAYIVARSGEIGQARAENKGKQTAEFEDVLEAAPFAVGSALLERIGAKGITDAGKEQLGAEMLKAGFQHVAKRVSQAGGKAASKEALTEFVQEGMIEYVGERFGTDAAMSFSEALDQGVAGAVAGGGYGGAAGTVSGLKAEGDRQQAVLEEGLNEVEKTFKPVLDGFDKAGGPLRLEGEVGKPPVPPEPVMTVDPAGNVDTEGRVSDAPPAPEPEPYNGTRYRWEEVDGETVLMDTETGNMHGNADWLRKSRESERLDGRMREMIAEADADAKRREEERAAAAALRTEPPKFMREGVKPTPKQVELAAAETNTEPTQAQIDADNYKKGRVNIAGLSIAIENPKGSTRSGEDADGNRWETSMAHHYGDIKGHKGADGEDIDVFIGDNPQSDRVFVVDQIDPKTGKFDEHKVMVGFDSLEEAEAGYRASYEDGWQGLGQTSEMTEADFKRWLKEGDTTQPLALQTEKADSKAEADAAAEQAESNTSGPQYPDVTATIEPLTERAVIIKGIPKEHKEKLGKNGLNAIWRRKEQGWMVPKKRQADVAAQLSRLFNVADNTAVPSVGEPPSVSQAVEIADSKEMPATPVTQTNRQADKQESRQQKADVQVSASGAPFKSEKAAMASLRSKVRDDKVEGAVDEYEIVPVGDGYGYRRAGNEGGQARGQDKAQIEGVEPAIDAESADAAGADTDGRAGDDRVDGEAAGLQSSVKSKPVSQDEEVQPVSNLDTQQVLEESLQAQSADDQADSNTERSEPPAAVEDAGEKLGGARKDELRTARERLESMDDKQIAATTMSKLWPKDEIKRIEDPVSAAIYYVARSEIPNKPRAGYKIKRWVEQVKHARDVLRLVDEIGSGRILEKIRSGDSVTLKPFADRVELLASIDRSQWDRIGRVEKASGRYNDGDKMVPGKWIGVTIDGRYEAFYGRGDVAEIIADVQQKLSKHDIAKPEMKFEIRRDSRSGVYSINKTGDSEYRALKTFDTLPEARDYLRNNNADLVEAWEAVKRRDNVTKADMRGDKNRERSGQDYRGGKDITPDEFIEAFGFRGVEFGNWVKQGKSGQERQGLLNVAYDAFMDLAKVLNLPPKALSLEGRLGIGFGSRGRGGAAAHYEPGNAVINLTKTKGAGSLAHEWFHALDNYFSSKRGGTGFNGNQAEYRKGSFVTYHPEPMMAYKPSIKGGREPYLITKAEYNRRKERGMGFEESQWIEDPNHPQGIRPEVERAFAELVATLDESPMKTRAEVIDKGKVDGYWSQIIERSARSFETHIIAKLAEQNYRNDFLANVTSFERFKRDPGRYPYLKPDEQGPVSDAFDKLFNTIETRADDAGNIVLFRQEARQPTKRQTVDQVQKAIAKQVLSWPKGPIVDVVQSITDLPQHIQSQIRMRKAQNVSGVNDYEDGSIWLVADNLRTPHHARQILAHEAVGHFAVMRMLGDDFDHAMNRIQYLKQTNPTIRKLAEQVKGEKDPYIESAEIVAKMAETGVKHPILTKVLAAVRRFLRKLGADFQFGMTELNEMLVDAVRYLKTGRKPGHYSVDSSSTGAGMMPIAFAQSTEELAKPDSAAILAAMRDKAEPVPSADISHPGVREQLEHGFFETPIGTVKLGQNQVEKLLQRGRHKEAAMVAPTLERPLLVVAEHKPHEHAERDESYLFIKSFEDTARGRFIELVAATVQKDGQEVMISAYRKREKQVLEAISAGRLLYMTPDLKGEDSAQPSQEQPALSDSYDENITNGGKNNKVLFSQEKDAPDDNSSSTLFSAHPEGKVLEEVQHYGSTLTNTVKSAFKKNWTADLRPAWLGALTRRHLADLAGNTLPQIKRYVKTAGLMDARRNELLSVGSELAEKWTAFNLRNRKEAQELAELMHDTTIAGVDPSRKYTVLTTPEDVEALRQKNTRLIKERSKDGAGGGKSGIRSDAHLRQEIEDAETTLAQERNRAKARAGLERRFNSLSPEAQALYREVRDAYKDRQRMTMEALERRIGRTLEDGEQAKALLDALRAKFESVQVQEPYFPLARFGRYWVSATRGDERVFEMFEEAKQQAEYIDKMNRQGYRVRHGAKLDDLKQLDGVSAKFIGQLDGMLDERLGDWPKVDALRDDIYQMYLQTLPDLSLRKHFIHRKKTAGYAKDALRAYADSMFHGSYQLARLEYSDLLDEQLREMREGLEADPEQVAADLALHDEAQGYSKLAEGSIRSMLGDAQRRINNAKGDPDKDDLHQKAVAQLALKYRKEPTKTKAEFGRLERTAQAAKQIGRDKVKATDLYNEMLKRHEWAMNPKGAAWANMASSIGFTWYLGVSPAAALVNVTQTPMVAFPMLAARYGWKESADALMNASREFVAGKGGVESVLTGDRLKAYREAVRTGVIDKTLAHDLAAVSQEGATYNPVRHKVMSVISWSFHNAERLNREVTYMAAYDLARAKGRTHRAAVDFAHEFVWDSHFDYSSGNKARFMQGDVAKVILMFRQFSLNMTYRLARDAYNSLKGESPEVKQLARRQLAGILGMHFMFAGAMGLPLWSVLGGVLNAIFDDEDDPWEFDTEFRNFLADTFGKEVGHAIAHGPVQALTGYGISGRVSLNNLWLRESNRELEGRDKVQYWFEQLLGPMGGIALGAGTASQLWSEGHHWRAIESTVPKFLKDGLKAIRYHNEGVNNLRGDTLVESMDWDKVVSQMLGMTPAELQERYEANNAIKNAEQRLKDRRRLLMNRFALAYRQNDPEFLAEVRREIVRFNKHNPPIRITRGHLMRSMRSRRSHSRDQIQGIVVDRKLRYLTENGRFVE